MPRLQFTDLAERDLLEIGTFIARDNPLYAARFVSRLENQCRRLSLHPLMGRKREDVKAGLRSIPLGRYVIFYRPIEGGVEILRVLHGARDVRRHLPAR